MRRTSPILPLLFGLLLTAGLSAPARAGVHVVDGVGGAPGTFASLQAAVDAAAPGDTVLVRHILGALDEQVVVDGKGLRILVDAFTEDVVLRKFTVRNLPAGQVLTARGLSVFSAADSVAMLFEDNAGMLRLYEVRGVGRTGQASTTRGGPKRDGDLGARFENCADVMLRDCGFGGGDGGTVNLATEVEPSDGGLGAHILDSNVIAFFTQIAGGDGGEVEPLPNSAAGGTGGTGLVAEGSTLFVYGSAPRGGYGGDGSTGPGGTGGTGYVQSGAGASYKHYNALPAAGLGGQGDPDGAAGTAQQILSGTVAGVALSPAFARDMHVNTPVREGEAISLTVTGFEDDAWLLWGLHPGSQLFPEYQGALMLAPPFSDLIYLGPVPLLASTFPLGTVPELGPGFDIVEVHLQVVMQVFGGQFNLISPEHLVMLDSSF